MQILQELNEKQQQAVTHTQGAILVVAGPGTGKTKVITHRIAYLIRQHQVPPQRIFAVTFTNKAAQEMLERVKELLGTTQGLDVRIHTFHAFCVNLLREFASEIGLSKNFTIFDQETQQEILIECTRELKLNRLSYTPWLLREIIGTYKIHLEDPEGDGDEPKEIRTRDGLVIDDPIEIQNITDLIKAYQSKHAFHNALDFDDLIFKSVEVLRQVPSVRGRYHNDIRYILVDEYQDINAAQYTLLKLLCRGPEHNMMVVADEDQSIYSWRGSTPQYIEQFKEEFEPTIVELEEHYRCSEKILRAAQAVISKNTRQKESVLKTHQGSGHTIYHYTFRDPDEEAAAVAKLIHQLVDQRHYSYGNIAVFYRTHQLAEALVDRLHHDQIEFQRVGRVNSFQEEHAKDIISYLNFIQWSLPRDLERAVNFPQQLIDDLTLVRLKWLAVRNDMTLVELLRKIEDYPEDVGPLTRRNVRQFLNQIDEFARDAEGEKISRLALKLFELLVRRRSPYRDEEIEAIEREPEIAYLRMAGDALYGTIHRGEPLRIVVGYSIDAYCAAHIVHQTVEKYLERSVQMEFLPLDFEVLEQSAGEVQEGMAMNLLIGDFEHLPDTQGTSILIGTVQRPHTNVLQLSSLRSEASQHSETTSDDSLGTSSTTVEATAEPQSNQVQSKSVIALKLCQRLLSYFETPNLADMVVYDLETIDHDPKRAEVIEIAAKRLSVIGSELERYYQLVKPPHPIPKSSTRIHGINNETVKEAPTIETVLPQFLSFVQDRILIGHNVAEFDNYVLERNLDRYLSTGLANPFYDTLATAQRLYPRESCTLEALAEKFSIEHDTMHRAIEDVHVNHRVFDELIKVDLRRREVRSLTEFLPLVGIGLLDTQNHHAGVVHPNVTPADSASTHGEPSPSEAPSFDETQQAFFQAAARYMQYHQPETDWLLTDFQPTEIRHIETYVKTLRQAKLPDFPEDADWESRRAKFMNAMLHFEMNTEEKMLSSFLDYQKLVNNFDETELEIDKITLMTLHTAKGTEFPVVIIMGMDEGTFPIWRKDMSVSELEEERRLFYVGMTRGKERLYLTSATYRHSDRERDASMFIREIPSNLLERWSPRSKRGR